VALVLIVSGMVTVASVLGVVAGAVMLAGAALVPTVAGLLGLTLVPVTAGVGLVAGVLRVAGVLVRAVLSVPHRSGLLVRARRPDLSLSHPDRRAHAPCSFPWL
jgi:hypothetical protein